MGKTLLIKRKYDRDNDIEKQWGSEVNERGISKCFVLAVERQDAATLLKRIKQDVFLGTTVLSEQWAACSIITDMPDKKKKL